MNYVYHHSATLQEYNMCIFKKLTLFIVLMLMLINSTSFAESLFPSANSVFGKAMPSLSSILYRDPDEKKDTSDGLLLIYHDFTVDNYNTFSRYLTKRNFEIGSIENQERKISVDITENGGDITFCYDYPQRTASILYKNGSRPENEPMEGDLSDEGVLPQAIEAFGVEMPSLKPFMRDEPIIEILKDGRTKYTYENITEEQYNQFSDYLSVYGNCSLITKNIKNETIVVILQCGFDSFEFQYNYKKLIAIIVYPELYVITDKSINSNDTIGLLPDLDQEFGVLLPRIDAIMDSNENKSKRLNDGTNEIQYESFTDNDYRRLSVLLKEKDCTVESYDSDESGNLTIQISRKGVSFEFVYDRSMSKAIVRYPNNCRIEPIITTPLVTPTPTSTPKAKTANEMSFAKTEDQCWSIAETYFFNEIKWKNPDSVKIWGHNTYDQGEGYIFEIDYSAQNSFGGNTRSTYYIAVSNIFGGGDIVYASETRPNELNNY